MTKKGEMSMAETSNCEMCNNFVYDDEDEWNDDDWADGDNWEDSKEARDREAKALFYKELNKSKKKK